MLRAALALLLVAALGVGGYFAYQHFAKPKPQPEQGGDPKPGEGKVPSDGGTEKPKGKLVVLVVFDQMRGDYLAKWAPYFGPDGFQRMKTEGVWFSEAQLPYACASTGPGHASLVTGAPPSVTGIIENEWFDRTPGVMKRIYCCQPMRPFALVPPLPKTDEKGTRGTDDGFSPERLLAETVGDKLKAATAGKGRVVSLSIKDRTAVLMGGLRPDAAYCFDTRDGLFHTGAYYRDQAHPWVAEFNGTKPADAWFGQKWERFKPELDYAKITGGADDTGEKGGEAPGLNGQGRAFPHPYKGQLTAPAKGYYDAVEGSPAGNEMLLKLATKAITSEKLGQGDTTDLLCVSFSSTDLIGHLYGPDSWEVFDITLRADKIVADLLAVLDKNVGKDRYSLVVSADHGVCPLPELKKFAAARRVLLLDKEGKNDIFVPLAAVLDEKYGKSPTGSTNWFETIGSKEQERIWPWVYLNHSAIKARGIPVEDVADFVREWLAGRDFIDSAFTRKQLETTTFAPADFGAKVKLAYHPDRCGDVIAVPKAGVLVTRYEAGTNHGTPHPYDRHVPVLAIGAGVPVLGEKKEKVSSLIVAPILAKSLGIDPPKHAVEKAPY